MAWPVSDARTAPAGRAARPSISVVVCTKDRPADLARALTSIRGSGELARTVELVVVEEASAPRAVPGVRYVHLPRLDRGFGYARNVAVRESAGEVVVFVDDDCEAEAGWLEALTAPFADSRVLGVAGAVLVRDGGLIGRAECVLGFPGGGLRYRHAAGGRVVPTRHLSTCNCAYRRDAVLAAGGFREDARLGGEDFLLAERVAALGPCVYAPAAVVYHRPRGRLGAIYRWFVRRGRSDAALLRAVRDRAAFARFLLRGSWTVRGLALGAVLTWRPVLTLALPAGVALYYGAILWRFRFARRYPAYRRAWWVVPVVKLTMDLGAEVGRVTGLLRGRAA